MSWFGCSCWAARVLCSALVRPQTLRSPASSRSCPSWTAAPPPRNLQGCADLSPTCGLRRSTGVLDLRRPAINIGLLALRPLGLRWAGPLGDPVSFSCAPGEAAAVVLFLFSFVVIYCGTLLFSLASFVGVFPLVVVLYSFLLVYSFWAASGPIPAESGGGRGALHASRAPRSLCSAPGAGGRRGARPRWELC